MIIRTSILVAICAVLTACAGPVIAGDDEAIAKARKLYRQGEDEAAIALIAPLVEKKNPEAMLLRASIYNSPTDRSKRDAVKAEALIDTTVQLSYPPALSVKASYLFEIDPKSNTVKDAGKGMQFLEQASKLGHAPASMELAFRYAQGRGVPKDTDKAFAFAKRGLDQGGDWAPSFLARSYRDGTGAEVDQVKAYAYFLVDCYRPQSGCEEADKLSSMLSKGEKDKAWEMVADVIHRHPNIVRVRPGKFEPRLQKASKSELIETYVKVSPIYAAHMAAVQLFYSRDTREILTYATLLSDTVVFEPRGKGWGSHHALWDRTYNRVAQGLRKMDDETRSKFQLIVGSSGPLPQHISDALSEDDLRDLIVLYRSPLGEKLGTTLRLATELQIENAKAVWEKFAASGRSFHEFSTESARSYNDMMQTAAWHKQRLYADCVAMFRDVFEAAGLGPVYSPPAPLAFVQGGIPVFSRHNEWVQQCADTDYSERRVLSWLPVGREAMALKKWREQWLGSSELKSLNKEYWASLEQLQREEAKRFRPPPRCRDGYWPESKHPDAPCVKRTDGKLRD